MAKVNRIVQFEMVDGWSLRAAATRSGWLVFSGTGCRREVSHETVAASGLRLVEASTSISEYDPVSAASGLTPRWIQAMWLGSVLVSGWALYLVSLAG